MGRGAPNARVEMGHVGSEDHHGEAGCLPAAHEDIRADLHAAVHGGSQTEAGKSMRRKECGRNCYGQMATPNFLPSLCQLRTVGGKAKEPGVKLSLRRRKVFLIGERCFQFVLLPHHLSLFLIGNKLMFLK